MSITLPAKDSALGRSLRVLGYQVGVLVLTYLLDPEFIKGVTQYYPQVAGLLVLGAPVLSLIRNLLKSDVPNS